MTPPKCLLAIFLIALTDNCFAQEPSKILSQVTVQPNTQIGIYGDLIVNNIPLNLGGEVHFNSQISTIQNSSPIAIDIVEFNMTDHIQLNTELIVTNKAMFNSGLVLTDLTDPLSSRIHFLESAISIGSNPNSYVDGAVSKSGSSQFTYPIGSDLEWAELSIAATTDPSNQFIATYSSGDVSTVLPTTTQACLQQYGNSGYWTLNRISGNEDVIVSVNFLEGDLPSDVICDNLLASWDGSKWVSEGNGGITGNNLIGGKLTSGTGCGSCGTTQAVQHYSYLAIATPIVITPVNFLSFSGEWKNKTDAELSWVVTNEENNQYFIIEQSIDGLNWVETKQIESLGNTSSDRSYSVLVSQLSQAPRYYFRLKQIDYNGSFEYFDELVMLDREDLTLELTSVFPNPVKDFVHVELSEDFQAGASIKIYNAFGKLVFERKNSSQFEEINLSNLPVGLYYLQLVNIQSNQILFVKKITKY